MTAATQFVRFAVVGSVCVGLNMVLFWFFVEWLGSPTVLATVLVFFLVNGYGYWKNQHWVFSAGRKWVWSLAFRYLLVIAAGLIPNVVLMYFLVDVIGVPLLVASALLSVLFSISNFLLHRGWTFRRKIA